MDISVLQSVTMQSHFMTKQLKIYCLILCNNHYVGEEYINLAEIEKKKVLFHFNFNDNFCEK